MIKKVLIGSAAVEKNSPGLLGRAPEDYDYLALDRSLLTEPGEEANDVVDGNGIIDVTEKYEFKNEVASLDEIYTLKVSHSAWVIGKSWMKHLSDIKKLQDAGAVLIPELYELAYSQWEIRKGKKNVNLNQDREEFFGNNVRRKYVHDSIHAAVAFNDDPMYIKILADGSSVKTSRKKFDNLSEEEKRLLVFEEVMVLSLERDLIPKNVDEFGLADLYSSYGKQLRLLMTQYSKGWFPLWIIQNFFSVNKPPLDYWTKFVESDKKVLL